MARRSRRAARFGAPRATPKPARWRVQARPLALVGGLVGGAGAAVLAQQYAVAPLTYATLAIAVGAGLGVAIVVPSAVFALAVVVHNLRAHRRSASAAVVPTAVVAFFVLASVLGAGVRSAGASIAGPCLGAVNGIDIGGRSPTKADAIDVAGPGRVHIVLRSFGTIVRGRLVARLPARDVTLRDVATDADLAPDPHVFEFDATLTESAWVGGGLQRLRAEAILAPEGLAPEAVASDVSCRADFMVAAEIDPLATMPGRAAGAAVLLGALLVLASAAGGARSVRVRSLNELRRSFADLEAARSHTARVGLPAGPSWARVGRPGAGRAPLPAQKTHWWRDNEDARRPLSSVPDPETAITRDVVAPVRELPGHVVVAPARSVDDDHSETTLAPVIAFEPRSAAAEHNNSLGAEADAGAATAPQEQEESADSDLAPVLSFEPRGSVGAPEAASREIESGYAFEVRERAEGEPDGHPEPAAPAPPVEPAPEPDVVAREDPAEAPEGETADEDLDATIAALEAAAKAIVASAGTVDGGTDGTTEPDAAEIEPAAGQESTVATYVPIPFVEFPRPVEPRPEPAFTRTGVRATARSMSSDATGAGVLGPPSLEATPVLGDASAAALRRWTETDNDGAMVPDLERHLQDVLNELPVGLVTRGRLSAAIDRTLMRAEVDEWVARVGRPSPLLDEADAWRAPLPDEILRGLLTPSPYVAGLADRLATRPGDEHDWDLCVQEVAWPWA